MPRDIPIKSAAVKNSYDLEHAKFSFKDILKGKTLGKKVYSSNEGFNTEIQVDSSPSKRNSIMIAPG